MQKRGPSPAELSHRTYYPVTTYHSTLETATRQSTMTHELDTHAFSSASKMTQADTDFYAELPCCIKYSVMEDPSWMQSETATQWPFWHSQDRAREQGIST